VLGRAPLDNPRGALRANMFARARIDVGGDRSAVVVPTSAVQRARSATIVFVKLADDQYETRRVTVGSTDGQTTTLLKGIAPGEEVVTTGSFLLKTETLKESIGAGCCEADERK
jgi:cobalt-zinc-cadmium efflux system membrane fusion protein